MLVGETEAAANSKDFTSITKRVHKPFDGLVRNVNGRLLM